MRKWIAFVIVVSVSFVSVVALQAFTNDTRPTAQKTTQLTLAQKKAKKSSAPSKKKKTFRRRVTN